jgi:hypothetical protein
MTVKFTQAKLIYLIKETSKKIDNNLSEDPEKDEDRIHGWVKRLITEHCEFKLQVASNEQKGWSDTETGLISEPMAQKKVTGRKQVMDYHPYISLNPDNNSHNRIWIPLSFGIERKSKQDWHGTLSTGTNYQRFKREILTFRKDPIFKEMYVFIESDFGEWLVFHPPIKRYTQDDIKTMIVTKESAIASIMARGVHIFWLGSRSKASKFVKTLCYQYAVVNYREWLFI